MTRVGDSNGGIRLQRNDAIQIELSRRRCRRRNIILSVLVIICAILAALFLVSTIVLATMLAKYTHGNNSISMHENRSMIGAVQSELKWPKPSGSMDARYKRAAIASDHGLCSEIGRDVMLAGGNAIDSAIAALVCVGVVNPQSSGLGGGFLMTIFNSSTIRCTAVDARETAPSAATQTMYVHKPMDSMTGYRSIAVPSELHGMYTVFKRFGSGKVQWSRLFRPSIDLAVNGFPVSSNLAMILKDKEKDIHAETTINRIFINPETSRVYEEGDVMKRTKYGFALELIGNSTDPIQLFYQGGIAQTIISEISENGGILTLDDLRDYQTAIHETPVEADLPHQDLSICGPPPPSSFVITQAIINVMAAFYGTQTSIDLNDPLIYHRLIETEKFLYAQRSRLGDASFVPSSNKLVGNLTSSQFLRWVKNSINDQAHPMAYYTPDSLTETKPDHGTSHVSVIDEYGNAVSVTSTVNQILGSMRASPTLGIIWNDEMDDFSTPGVTNGFGFAPSESNFIVPGKRPMSSMSPSIIYHKNTGKVKMVVGASGGSMIISSTAQTAIRALIFNQTIKEAVDAPRFHNQFIPHVTIYEQSVPTAIINDLRQNRHQNLTGVAQQKSTVQALILAEDGFIHGNSDFRRPTATYPAGF